MTTETPKNGFHIEYYGNEGNIQCPGEKWKEGNYKDGEKTGLWTWWYGKYLGGLKSVEENYKDGKLHGLTIHWDTDGRTITSEENYKNGYIVKEVRYENGYKSKQINYVNGRIEGKYTEFYKNGNKKCEGNATSTTNRDYPFLKRGKWVSWYETGEKWFEKHYSYYGVNEVTGVTTFWHKNGQKQSTYENNMNLNHWDEDGNDVTQKVRDDVDEHWRVCAERRKKRGIQTRGKKRNDSLEGRNVPLTDDEKELGADFWSDIYGDDFIDEDPF